MNEEQVAKLEEFVNEFNQKLSAVEQEVGELRHNFMMLLTSLGFVEEGCEEGCEECCETTPQNHCGSGGGCDGCHCK